MNAKKCKAIRREIKARGIDPTQKEYEGVLTRKRIKGKKETVDRVTGKLKESCGRALYKKAKKAAR